MTTAEKSDASRLPVAPSLAILPLMADRGRHTPSTTNQAVMIAQNEGRKVPDIYATDDQNKFGDPHAKLIHDYDHFDGDTPVDDPC